MASVKKFRILYIASGDVLKARVEPLLWIRTCEQLFKRRMDIRLVSVFVKRADNINKAEIWTYYGINRHLPITVLPTPISTSSSVAWRNIWGAFFNLLYALVICLKRRKIDAIYSKKIAYILPYKWLKKLLGDPIFIFETHALPKNRYAKYIREGMDGIITNSKTLKEDLTNLLSVAREKICVAYLAPHGFSSPVCKSKYEARRLINLDIPDSTKIVTYTGKLLTHEIDVILKASRYLGERVTFVIVGGNPQSLKDCRSLSIKQGVNNVIFVGFVPPTRVQYYQVAADVLLVNYTQRQNDLHRYMTPGKLFDYLVIGRPIVSSCFDALGEILRGGENAFLFKAGDHRSLANAIERVLSDEDLAMKISEKAYYDSKRYTWEARTQIITEFMQGLLDQRKNKLY